MPILSDILVKCLRLFACCFYNPTRRKYETNLGQRGEISLCVGNNRRITTTSQLITRNQKNNNTSVVEYRSRSKEESSDASNPNNWELFNPKKICTYEYGDIILFHDQSLSKIMRMIKTAVDKDQLKAVDPTVKFTSSAVDTIAMFSQIKDETYRHINLQDIGKDTKLIAMIIDDLTRCCVYYVDEIFRKIDLITKIELGSKVFQISKEWCYGINSALFIKASLYPFVNRMKLDEIRGCFSKPELWKSNLLNAIDKTNDEIERKISFQVEMAAEKMSSAVKNKLLQCLSNPEHDHQKIIDYLSSNFLVASKLLDSKHFDLLLQCCWSNMLNSIPTCMNENETASLKTKHKITESLEKFLSIVDERQVLELETIHKLITKLKGGTDDYIHQYYLTRLNYQKSLTDHSSGLVTVKAHFSKNELFLEILNAQHIVPPGKSGTYRLYIKINFLPKHEFEDIQPIKTWIHKKTKFEEKHFRCLSPNQYSIKNALLHFTLKKSSCLKVKKKFMGEAFMLLNDISRCESSNCLCRIEQSHLILNRPTSFQCYPCHILKQISDKKAVQFLKKEGKKIKSKQQGE